jgi:hypothetical protein
LTAIDTVTLSVTDVGPLGVGSPSGLSYGGLAYDPASDQLYMIGGRDLPNLYTVDRSTGTATLVGSYGIADLFGLEYDQGGGTLYGSQGSSGTGFYRIDPATGSPTFIANLATASGRGVDGLGLDTLRNQLVGVVAGENSLYAIDRTTGATTLLLSGLGLEFVNNAGLAYDRDLDRLWAIDATGKLLSYCQMLWTSG